MTQKMTTVRECPDCDTVTHCMMCFQCGKHTEPWKPQLRDEFDTTGYGLRNESVIRPRYSEPPEVDPEPKPEPQVVIDKNTPPRNKEGLTLSQRQYVAATKAQELQWEIDRCPHQWVEGTARMETHALDLGESIGSSNIYVLRQHRTCSVCGVEQTQTKFEPDWGWSKWE